MLARVGVATAAAQVRRPWIWGPTADLGWIVLCPLLAFAALHGIWAQHAFSDRNLYAVMFCFVVNAHHMPACLRAFGEPVIYRRHKARLWTALLFMPVLAMLPFALGNGMAVLCVVALFDLWHVAMQQHGLGRIYAAKAGERSRHGARLELACTLTWYASVVVFSDSWMAGLADTLRNAGLPVLDALSVSHWQVVRALFAAASLAGLVAYVRHALGSYRAGLGIAWAKHALHGVAFAVLWTSYQDRSWYRAQSTQNLFHALQYFFMIWIYGHLAARREPLAYPQLYTGLFEKRRGILRFGLLLALYGLFFYILRAARTGLQLGALAPAQLPLIPAGWSVEHSVEMLASFSIASLFVHFYVDSFIWKVRSGPVRTTLQLDAAAQPQLGPSAAARSNPAHAPESAARGIAHALGYFGVPVVLIALLGASRAPADAQHRLPSLRHAAALFPESAAAQAAYGEAALQAGASAVGEAALLEAARLSPTYQGPARALWELARRGGRNEDALRWGLMALDAQPEDARLRYQVAVQLAEAGRVPEARAELKRLLSVPLVNRDAAQLLATISR
jgi:tetratricopeptide (TPR) repeat protein